MSYEMEFEIGTKVTWETVNGPRTGVVINHRGSDYIVDLGNGKCVLVGKGSIKNA